MPGDGGNDMAMTEAITEAIERLARSKAQVTAWEASFLASVTRRGCHSPKQRHILVQLVEKYLHDTALAAEILGQERLFA
jgi:hypothetical protein